MKNEKGGERMQVGVGVLLFVVFLVLKLMDVIDWSWLWVTSPLWISALIGAGVLAVWVFFVRAYERDFNNRTKRFKR